MSDKELLELAAKAAGYGKLIDISKGLFGIYNGSNSRGLPVAWNPLTNDGDALRLAVKLELMMNIGTEATIASNKVNGEPDTFGREQHKDSDPYTATRRAIVRAAAEIGKQS